MRAGVGVVGRAAVAVRPDGGVAGGASGSAPGITTLTRLVAEVRTAENARLYGMLAERTPAETAAALRGLPQVPEDRRVSEVERLRTSPVKASGRVRVPDCL